ncbi:carboxypeptidase-like regulatory domain-containing protein [Maribacter aquimaris]|uniref:carboxypeptidase-like regulatory domain-containing protein n=1 Tax=Maribacter aquimaris TaxID=2737171 RepID=UPI001CB6D1D0|nr:carboxypeptidase-like regulatory domain-containing protein [Maribacter aquimaris]
MTRSRLLLPLFFVLGAGVGAQTLPSKQLEGRVYSDSGDVAATHVLNVTSKKASITDQDGFFSITVRLNDTLVFSAVQYKRKTMRVTQSVLESKLLYVPMEELINQLDEVIVMPYNLTGNMATDLGRTIIDPVVTSSTLGLPNAYVKLPTKAERELFAATANPIMSFDPLINAITGRTKMLKQRVARNKTYERTQRVRAFYADSLYTTEFKIPQGNIDDFMYFCEVDPVFQTLVDSHDRFKIWEFMRRKSVVYRENNRLD